VRSIRTWRTFSRSNGRLGDEPAVTSWWIVGRLFTGWALDSKTRHEEFMNGEIRSTFYAGWVLLVRFVAPLAIAIILARSLL
jgi:SNF family Na+-dependent transporter